MEYEVGRVHYVYSVLDLGSSSSACIWERCVVSCEDGIEAKCVCSMTSNGRNG